LLSKTIIVTIVP